MRYDNCHRRHNGSSELTNKIFEHVIYSFWENETPDEARLFDRVINLHRRPVERSICRWPAPGDVQLRLVSSAFNRAMLRVYFKYEGAVFSPSEEKALERLEEYVISQERSVPWSIPAAIEKFTIELCPPGYGSEANIFHESHEDMSGEDMINGRIPKLDECAARLRVALEKGTLARAVQRMPKLGTLIVNLNQDWRDDEQDDWDGSEDELGTLQSGLQLRLELLEMVREGVATIFRPVDAPDISARTNHLPFLTHLRLTLPCVYDFAHLASCMPDAVALRLRHLYLEVVDGTGPGGDRMYCRAWQGDGDPSGGDEDFLFSNLQRKFPNTDHMQGMCSLVNRCKNLESLGLKGTQCINLAGLDWRPTNGVGLKNIYMSRVVATAEQLLTLLSSVREDGACHVEAFKIEEVELMDGTWESVFARLLSSSTLVFFYVYNLIYSLCGGSAHLRKYNHRPWENVSEIWSKSRQDHRRLRDVIRAVESRGINGEDRMIRYVEMPRRGTRGADKYSFADDEDTYSSSYESA
jgi:hypothetical protein